MASIELSGIKKRYPGGFEAVKGLSLDIRDGEMLVLVGPSGCGKSTLLRMVAGLETVTEGEIHIGERVVNAIEPADRDIAMVFQNYALYPHMSVYQNLAYGLKNRKMPKAEIKRRVEEAAQILEIGALLDRKPRQLSGGQRQRVAMGRAIVREPAVFLFDEPLSNLDAKLRVQMRLEIKALQKKLGVTSIYVTHDQVEAMTLADRMIVMNAGRAEQVGAPLEVYARPQTTFVAGFIGSPPMNFIDPELLAGSAELAALSGQNGVAQVGVRPETLQLAEEGQGHLGGTVFNAEPLGAETLVHIRLADNSLITVRQDATTAMPGMGDPIFVRLDAKALHLFDAGGVRLP